jgi:hypothetical protein
MSLSCEGGSPKERGFTQSLPVAIERKISMGSKDTQTGDRAENRDLDCFSDNFITTPENIQTVSIAALLNGEVGRGMYVWRCARDVVKSIANHLVHAAVKFASVYNIMIDMELAI